VLLCNELEGAPHARDKGIGEKSSWILYLMTHFGPMPTPLLPSLVETLLYSSL
jgi:hypothetical protein